MATIVLSDEYGSIGVDPDVWIRASKRFVRLHAQFRARRRPADSVNSARSAYSLHVHTSGGSRFPKRSSFRAGPGSSRRAPGDRRAGSGPLVASLSLCSRLPGGSGASLLHCSRGGGGSSACGPVHSLFHASELGGPLLCVRRRSVAAADELLWARAGGDADRKSTRLNSSHAT